MNKNELRDKWHDTLNLPSPVGFNVLAQSIVDLYATGDDRFRQHVKNRFEQVTKATGQEFDPDNFDLDMARAFVADEVGFESWPDLLAYVEDGTGRRPILFRYAVAAMQRGDFTSFDEAVGGAEKFDESIRSWNKNSFFDDEPETRNELFAAACMLGHTKTAEFLLDAGVDPYTGMRTWLAGPHWAASSGRLDTIKKLLDRGVPLEVENKYGGTVLGQALWSAINENHKDHAAIIEALIMAGAEVEPGTLEWWEAQDIPDRVTRERVSNVLKTHADFHHRVDAAKEAVAAAESTGVKKAYADSLKALGNILRRPPFTRDAANEAYTRAADLYRELGLHLEEAWVKRHIGINLEYGERLEDAEKMYDEALSLYRRHATDETLDYANTVRYPAVVKNRLGKRDESATLWEEVHNRYAKIGPGGLGEGVAEAAAWLTIFALDKNDLDLASKWFAQASKASAASGDPDTHKFIAEVKERLESRGADS